MSKKREEFSEELKWNVKDLYTTEEEYQFEYNTLQENLKKFKNYQGHLLENAETLYQFLEFDNDFSCKLEQVYIYAHIQNDQDTTNTKFQILYKKAYKLNEQYREVTSYVIPEILKGSYEKIEQFIIDYPDLKKYKRILQDIFKSKKYVLSDKEEMLISSLGSTMALPEETFSLLSDADLKFGSIINEQGEKEELNERSYRKFIESLNRSIRKSAFKKLYSTYSNFKNTYASLLAGEVNKNNKIAKIRGYNSALENSLFVNDIPLDIYLNLIKTVKKNTHYQSKYWKIKRKMLGLSSLHLYDTYASPLKETPQKYTIAKAKEVLFASLGVLGKTYITDLQKAFDEKWIDFCPNEGKRSGAYCTACYNVHPYVLVNFDGSLNNVSTLAHELGHAMHYYYAIKNQNYQDYGYSIFVAEVASQVNQILLSKYLIENTNNIEEKKYLIDDLIQDFKSTIYRQTMFADFEYQIHELEQKGEVLTHEILSNLYYKLNKEYFAKNIVVDEEIKFEWSRIPHFYMNFYVYQYATAYAAAILIVRNILNSGCESKACKNYLEFLKLGCTKTPIESLKIAGVDMMKQETLEEAFVYFDELITELENLSLEV